MGGQWIGFIVEKTENRNHNDCLETFMKKDPKCMVQQVDCGLLSEIKKDSSVHHDFKIGDWVLTSGGCQLPGGICVEPPFSTMELALDFARQKFGVNNFIELEG
jgi:hypothetical protein